MRRRPGATAWLLSVLVLAGCRDGPSAPASGVIEIYAVNGTQATIMAGPDVLFFLKPGESTFVREFTASPPSTTSKSFQTYDFVDNTPVAFLEVAVSIPSPPTSGCRANVTITRDSATSDGQSGVRVDSVHPLP
jgi:hypothetical protein